MNMLYQIETIKPKKEKKGKIPKKERDETSLNEEPVKPSNSKTQEKMHTDSVFDELGLVEELATSLRTSHRETPRSNKNRESKACKGLSSLR